jgi:hypothetical protein
MTTVTTEKTKKEQTTFKDLALGDAYYSFEYPNVPCIKATDEICLFYDIEFQRWDYTDEKPTEPVCKIDAEIKFIY